MYTSTRFVTVHVLITLPRQTLCRQQAPTPPGDRASVGLLRSSYMRCGERYSARFARPPPSLTRERAGRHPPESIHEKKVVGDTLAP